MSGVILNGVKKRLKGESSRNVQWQVFTNEQDFFPQTFSSNFRHSYKNVWKLFSKNKEIFKWISTIVMFAMLHF